jgi:hypothetical protein
MLNTSDIDLGYQTRIKVSSSEQATPAMWVMKPGKKVILLSVKKQVQ